MFNREIEAAETWMGAREAFLASEDVGGSLDGVEALIKKHEDFDKSLNAQVTPVQNLFCLYFSPTALLKSILCSLFTRPYQINVIFHRLFTFSG